MREIKRHSGQARGRSRVVSYGDLVFTVATSEGEGESVEEQTALALEALDRNLADAGTDRTRILTATVYLSDIDDKAAMDRAWCAWIGPPEQWPQRACVQAALVSGTLVEITLIAGLA